MCVLLARILGACKVLLQQGRYTFSHDTVLHNITESPESFILNMKQAELNSPKSSIKFLKKGAKVPCKRTLPVGILHQVSGWVLLVDLDRNYCLPMHIDFTQLRSDIIIFSNALRKVILLELTYLSEKKHGIMAQY